MAGFVDLAAADPGRFTHPDPSNFVGATFLKQALVLTEGHGTIHSIAEQLTQTESVSAVRIFDADGSVVANIAEATSTVHGDVDAPMFRLAASRPSPIARPRSSVPDRR